MSHADEGGLVSGLREYVGDHELRAHQFARGDQSHDHVFHEDSRQFEMPRPAGSSLLGDKDVGSAVVP